MSEQPQRPLGRKNVVTPEVEAAARKVCNDGATAIKEEIAKRITTYFTCLEIENPNIAQPTEKEMRNTARIATLGASMLYEIYIEAGFYIVDKRYLDKLQTLAYQRQDEDDDYDV